ncbi:MAG: type II secretion system F family protein [Candidatus Omnitrophica bacterium]|nr:type II secretion system F family protein [Candidatus Omnitrophota bacterium]
MYWKIEALTAKRSEITQTFDGSLEDAKNQALVYGLEILNITPDYPAFIKSIFQNRRLSSSVLSVFFKDFADMQKCGLSVNEAINTLNETSSNPVLKEALKKICNFINDGRSLEESFENTKIFSKIVCVSLSAAEKTGNIPELSDLLAQYYNFKDENQKKITRALIYPGVIFCLLTGLSIFISIKLVPLLKAFLPSGSGNSLSAMILVGYAGFIKEYWWVVISCLVTAVFLIKHLWHNYSERLMEVILSIPLVGDLIKNIELSHVFLNLYVYQKSGVNIVQTITNIHQASNTCITGRLILIRERIFKGISLGDAFKQDPFFPPFVCQNLSKGQVSGFLPQYLERIYKYYDIKSKESIAALIAIIEPSLLVVAALFLLTILCSFILPIYTNINRMGEGVFK